MLVKIRGGEKTVSLRIDGVPLAVRDDVASWRPTGDRHTFTFVGARGDELDRVDFEVRGAGVQM